MKILNKINQKIVNKVFIIGIIIISIILIIITITILVNNKKVKDSSHNTNLPTLPTDLPLYPTKEPIQTPTQKPTQIPTQTPKPITPLERLKNLFNNTDTDLNNVGGLLAKNFVFDSFETFLKKGDVELIDTGDCASVNRHTCAAYTYIRKDLSSMLFMYPTTNKDYFTPCGIIFDMQKIWSLVTLTAIIDADTNIRNCLTNESGADLLIYNPFYKTDINDCVLNTLTKKYGKRSKYLSYAVYLPSENPGGSCPTSCNGDLTCMYNNSGGTINMWYMLGNKKLCQDGYADCFDYIEVSSNQVPNSIKNNFSFWNQPSGYLKQTINQNCQFTKKPFLYVFEDYKENNKYDIVVEDNRIAVYIGENGEGFQEIIGDIKDPRTLMLNQARFEKKDWNLWIKVLKDYYQILLNLMNSDNSMKSNFSKYSYILANPADPSFIENEVNVYIDPDTTTTEYQKQNKIFQDAILGFYYIGTDCDEQLKDLQGVNTTYYNYKYNSNTDRCNGFYNMAKGTRQKYENDNIQKAKKLAHQVAKMFNEKHNKNLPVFKCSADSSTFPNYKHLEKALQGKTNFDDIFTIETE